MRINVEIHDRTRVNIHDLRPSITCLTRSGGQPLYVLTDEADRFDQPCVVSVFLADAQIKALYEQLKAILEPNELSLASSTA